MCPRGRPRGQGRPRGLHLCSEELKTWYFSYSTFWLTGQCEGRLPLGYPTESKEELNHYFARKRVGS